MSELQPTPSEASETRQKLDSEIIIDSRDLILKLYNNKIEFFAENPQLADPNIRNALRDHIIETSDEDVRVMLARTIDPRDFEQFTHITSLEQNRDGIKPILYRATRFDKENMLFEKNSNVELRDVLEDSENNVFRTIIVNPILQKAGIESVLYGAFLKFYHVDNTELKQDFLNVAESAGWIISVEKISDEI